MMVVKTKKQKVEDYKNCLQATPLENKRNHPEKSKIYVDSLRGDNKAFIKNNTLIKKTTKFFTEEINKIGLSLNDDKKIQWTDLIETYAYGTSKDLVCKKEEIKCNNIIKQYKKWLTLMMLQKKT